jgi:hypothetical protein
MEGRRIRFGINLQAAEKAKLEIRCRLLSLAKLFMGASGESKMRFFRNSSIQRKLTMVVFLTSVLGLSMAGLAFEWFERARFRSALSTELSAQADTLGVNAAVSLIFNDRKSARDVLRALRVERQIEAARIYDKEGRVFAEYRRDGLTENFIMPRWQGDAVRFAPELLTVFRSFSFNGERA